MIRLENSVTGRYWQVAILEVLVFGLLIAIYSIELALGMDEISQIAVQEILLLVIFFALNYYWIKQSVRLAATVNFGKTLLISVPFILVLLYLLLISLAPHSTHTIVMAAVSGIGAGVFEEYLFRGLILGILLKSFPHFSKTKTIWYAVTISSILFGIAHGSNFMSQSVSSTLVQIFCAISIGFLLSALYLRSGSIIVPMLFHAAWDATIVLVSGSTFANVGSSTFSPLATVGELVLFVLIAMFYFRKSKLSEIDLKHFE